ncbi:MAG: hypothetical protein ACYC1D_13875 [Acidimicrobiales bacterium]
MTRDGSGQPSYSLVVSRGYVRLVREGRLPTRRRGATQFAYRDGDWVEPGDESSDPDVVDDIQQQLQFEQEMRADLELWGNSAEADPELRDLLDEYLHPRRGERGLSSRSRMNMRRLFVSLPWELVGPHPALISLTYPGFWQPWVVDGRAWEVHRRAFERRWVRRWKDPLVGVWVKEFQNSGRPHLHLYVGLPSATADEDFIQLRERTLQRHRLQRQHGKFQGRKRTPPLVLGPYGSEFGRWLVRAWLEIVGTNSDDSWKRQSDPNGRRVHRTRGADVAVMFWSDEAEGGTDRTRVAQYLAAEAGKFAQKKPPPGFERIGRYYGVWGRSVGFQPETSTTPLDPDVAAEVEARLARWVRWKLHVLRQGAPPATPFLNRRRGDGVTAFGLGPQQAERILTWSQRAASRRQARSSARVAGGAAPGDLAQLLRSVDLTTGEIRPAADHPVSGPA